MCVCVSVCVCLGRWIELPGFWGQNELSLWKRWERLSVGAAQTESTVWVTTPDMALEQSQLTFACFIC